MSNLHFRDGMVVSVRISRFPFWAWILTGFLAAGRAFAYLGVPPLFIGEAYLGWNMLRNRHNWLGRFVDDVLRFELVSVGVAANLAWAGVEVVRCFMMGRSLLEIFRTAALDYYPLYVLAAIAIGSDVTTRQFVRIWKMLSVIYSIYAIFAVLILDKTNFDFGLPAIAPVVPIVSVAIWPYLRDWKYRYLVLCLSLFPTMFGPGHGRGPLLGLVCGFLAVALSYGVRISRMISYVIGGFLVAFVIGPLIPGLNGQSPPLDPVVHIARMVATFNPDLAGKILDARGYHDEAAVSGNAEGTAKWRQAIWTNAIHSLNTTTLMLMGQGHGTSLRDMTPNGEDIHTPHNFTIYCLFYTGAVGLVLFCFFLIALLVAGRQIQDKCLRSALAGVVWATVLIAVTGDCFETPFGAVPFYLLYGLILGVARNAQMARKRVAVALSRRQSQMNANFGLRQADLVVE